MSGRSGSISGARSILKVMPDLLLVAATFVAVLVIAPISQGYAFPSPPPPELLALSKSGASPVVDACQSAWLSFASLTGATPSYFNASLGPNFGSIANVDRSTSILLATTIACMVAINIAFARHVHNLLAPMRR